MKIGIPQIVAVIVIIAMIYGLRQADLAGWFDSPQDLIPSVEIGK